MNVEESKLEQAKKDEDYALNQMQNKVYAAAVTYFEYVGENNHLTGNGHHAAQRVAEYAKNEWIKMSNKMETPHEKSLRIAEEIMSTPEGRAMVEQTKKDLDKEFGKDE